MPKTFHANGILLLIIFTGLLLFAAQAQQPAQPAQPSEDVPVTDAQSGPCSIELTVSGTDTKPVYAARIDYKTAYGFMGTHKLDMTVYTNAQGRARFTGIPARVRKPPIEFRASKGDLVGVATMDPANECQARHDIMMDKPKPQ
ncbi:MAG TPA: hypothetical protein VJW55_11280 [Candidatus Angelobacter sp.]|jgi:hypothetical protein|nr:hypothetical protein [Candidatus Angelobacter sp.]